MNRPILDTRELRKQYTLKTSPFLPAQTINAVDGINLTLRPGETVGLAGESGCGKSTAARMLMGLIPPTSGQILFNGEPLESLNRERMSLFRKTVQMVFQDPFSSLNPRMRIGEIIGEPMLIHRLCKPETIRGRVIDLMEKVGLSAEQYDRYPHEFSGGQRQRIGIARALSVNPQALIADEPLSALDISIQAQIINLLLDIQKNMGLAYILISHDLSVIRHLSNRIAIMYLGRIVEEGETEKVFTGFLHPYTETLINAIPGFSARKTETMVINEESVSPSATYPSGCNFHPRCPYRQEICKTTPPLLETKENNHKAACHFSETIYRQDKSGSKGRANPLDKAAGRADNF